ncbi:MAG: 6-hydroxycyclohex-1-ene-1-carbonyl-CoA dehydrogenase [Rhodospirillales bacterium]|nr:6-hydroxycyclohex-1-ene-1-carbonyl-CoA dehydrogenase [Rhodospirillales bacterium]
MSHAAYRWEMREPGKPMERAGFDLSPIGDNEVVVEIAGCGVCHTDLGYFYDGVRTTHELPLALGHEVSGRVIAAGPKARGWAGKAVIVPAVIPCGICDHCKRGKETICRNQVMPGYDIQGGFASHIVVPFHGLCEVDETRLAKAGLDLADLSVIADAVTTPYQAVIQADVGPDDLVVVVGIGGVGGYCAQIAASFGATVVVVDIDEEKLKTMTEHGAALALNPKDHPGRELRKAVTAFASDNNLRTTEWIIFECSGTAKGQETAFGLLVHGATLGVVGFTMDRVEVRLSNLMAFHARALGNWGCPPRYYPEVLDLVLDQKINVKSFVEHRPLDDINAMFELVQAHQNKARLVLIPGD